MGRLSVPASVAAASVAPASVAPASVAPASVASPGVTTASVTTASVTTASVTPSSVTVSPVYGSVVRPSSFVFLPRFAPRATRTARSTAAAVVPTRIHIRLFFPDDAGSFCDFGFTGRESPDPPSPTRSAARITSSERSVIPSIRRFAASLLSFELFLKFSCLSLIRTPPLLQDTP